MIQKEQIYTGKGGGQQHKTREPVWGRFQKNVEWKIVPQAVQGRLNTMRSQKWWPS